ncbi:MAG: restriction endonuclease [Pseudomarimonas sp.]
MDTDTSLFLFAGLAAVATTAIVAVVLYRVLGLARDRYEVSSGLAQLAQISWHELQVLIGLGLRGRGLGAISSGDHDDPKGGASDLLLTDGEALQLLRVKHGGGIQVDDHTIFDLATRRDARRAAGAVLATTGSVSRAAQLAAKDAAITLIAGPDLWALVNEHLPPRLRERIASRRRNTLRARLGVLIGGSALAGASALALVFHLARANLIFATPPDATAAAAITGSQQPVAVTPATTILQPAQSDVAARAATSVATPAPANTAAGVAATVPATASAAASVPANAPTSAFAVPQQPLDEAGLQERRRETAQSVRTIAEVFSARWSTASTLEVEIKPTADLLDDTLFERVCAILHDTEELRFTRVQLQLKDADPTKGLAARWRQCM